jgi:thioredoxin 1
MKKIIYLVLLISALFSCKKSDVDQKKIIDSKTNDIKCKVTFIELGSVRCIPCKMMQTVMKQIEDKFKDQVNIVFYDVWTEKDAPRAGEYKIKVIPTQVFLDENGTEYFRHEGYFPFEELVKVLSQKGVE